MLHNVPWFCWTKALQLNWHQSQLGQPMRHQILEICRSLNREKKIFFDKIVELSDSIGNITLVTIQYV